MTGRTGLYTKPLNFCIVVLSVCAALAHVETAVGPNATSGEYPQWCGRADRNRIIEAGSLPASFAGRGKRGEGDAPVRNAKWVARLGRLTYGSPVVAGGKVYIGGCLEGHMVNAIGALWCFRESDGSVLWRLRSPFIKKICNGGWGITSTPTIEGERAYLLGQVGEVLCLDANGLADGNDGPFQDEAAWLATDRGVTRSEIADNDDRIVEYSSGTPVELKDDDADIIWRFDMVKRARCWPYNAGNAAILVRGDYLYVATCSVDCNYEKTHKQPLTDWKAANPGRKYPSPNLIVLNKETGDLLAVDETGAFGRSFHGAHSSLALAKVNGREMLVWGSGDAICYGIDPNFVPGEKGAPGVLKTIWQFDCTKPPILSNDGKPVRRLEIFATPVVHKNRVYVAVGTDLIHTGRKATNGRLVCIDATGTGDITETRCVWRFDGLRSSACTVAIADGLLYTGDASGMVYCLDAETGQVHWAHKTKDVWASPLVADGKVYVATYGKGLAVFAHGKEKKVISEAATPSRMAASPAVANGVLYLADQRYLYAVEATTGERRAVRVRVDLSEEDSADRTRQRIPTRDLP